ncbi:MAG TPA: hypothetical protein VFC46_14420 [Humisphaera sp.]|nr:hypothetical protein [Humisphaera sp.]
MTAPPGRIVFHLQCIDPAPLGFINADGRPGCLCLSTFHTFPLEHTVTKTQSPIEKRG